MPFRAACERGSSERLGHNPNTVHMDLECGPGNDPHLLSPAQPPANSLCSSKFKMEGLRMVIDLNHTIIPSRDSEASATFLAQTLGISGPTRWGPFQVVPTGNGVNMDFMNV